MTKLLTCLKIRPGNSVKECVAGIKDDRCRAIVWEMVSRHIMKFMGASIEEAFRRGA